MFNGGGSFWLTLFLAFSLAFLSFTIVSANKEAVFEVIMLVGGPYKAECSRDINISISFRFLGQVV